MTKTPGAWDVSRQRAWPRIRLLILVNAVGGKGGDHQTLRAGQVA
jgi:hypothetical protein